MKKKRSLSQNPAGYDMLKVKLRGEACTVFLCRHCSKAWKLRNPVEAWRIKTLLVHFGSHRTDAAVSELMEGAAKDIEA